MISFVVYPKSRVDSIIALDYIDAFVSLLCADRARKFARMACAWLRGAVNDDGRIVFTFYGTQCIDLTLCTRVEFSLSIDAIRRHYASSFTLSLSGHSIYGRLASRFSCYIQLTDSVGFVLLNQCSDQRL